MKKELPLYRAILWIMLSTVLFSGVPALLFFLWEKKQEERRLNPKYHLKSLVQVQPYEDSLDTLTLQKILGLSTERPITTIDLDLGGLEKRLLEFPLVERAKLKVISPSKLFIKYKLRTPIAFLADIQGAAVDKEGKILPLDPFYTPKRLPSVYVGLQKGQGCWGGALAPEDLELIWEVFTLFASEGMEELEMKSLNISGVHETSGGKRELVVIAEDLKKRIEWVLRLCPEAYTQGLSRFLTLRDRLLDQELANEQVVDLRLDRLAFLKPGVVEMKAPSL